MATIVEITRQSRGSTGTNPGTTTTLILRVTAEEKALLEAQGTVHPGPRADTVAVPDVLVKRFDGMPWPGGSNPAFKLAQSMTAKEGV